MTSRFEEIKKGLLEVLAYERGELTQANGVRVHRMAVIAVPEYTPTEVKEIRINAHMTQAIFAACIGVSKKAVEAWEGGRSKPDGAARRLLGLMKDDPQFAEKMGIYIR